MKKENILYIIMFIITIILIILVMFYNVYKDNLIKTRERKSNYVIGNYNINEVYVEGLKLFFQGVELLNTNVAFDYEKDEDNRYKLYSFSDYKDVKKIININKVLFTLNKDDIDLYMKEKGIIEYEGSYYIKESVDKTNNYVGSKVDIKGKDKEKVTFKSINYFCNTYSYNYIGLLDRDPDCEYHTNETEFNIVLNGNNLRLKDYNEIKNILK